MKISIRVSILSLLLTLVVGVSLLIVGINYFTLNKILIKTTKNSLDYASDKVSEQIARYFQPLDRLSLVGAHLIHHNVIIPEYSNSFVKFLHSLLAHETGITAAYWADSSGNYYLLRNTNNDQQINENIIVDSVNSKSTEDTYESEDMNLIGAKETPGINFDPRLRPWYQQAKFKKQPAWLIYPLVHSSSQKAELGITVVQPIFDDKSKILRGVLGMDMPLDAVSVFVKNINITKNSVVFICDDQGHLITAYSANTNLLQGYKMPKLEDLGLNWVMRSFDLYHQNHEQIFIYNNNNKEYIAAYKKIPGIASESTWHIAIVTPIQDIIGPLQKIVLFSLIFIFTALVLGIILSSIFSSRLSNPIIKLAKDADLICQLNLEKVTQLYSHIKEIAYMTEAFIKMRNVLYSFQRYIPITLVKNLISSGKVAKVGGETKEITLLFSDIENFTPISESMSPQNVMLYLSEYFQAMTKTIISMGGTVDKYIGDGAMAFWGIPIEDPQHALHACQAVLQIRAALVQLNSKWHSEGIPQNATRFGINTGQAIVGNVGSDDRLSYTALGDSVNLASRLESLNKTYSTYTLVGENTYNIVKDYFNFRLIDKVTVKGKTQGVYIYELLDEKIIAPNLQLEHYNCVFQEAFNSYERGEWEKACLLFSELANKNPQDHLLQIFIGRCQNFGKNPPQNWTGVWIMDHK